MYGPPSPPRDRAGAHGLRREAVALHHCPLGNRLVLLHLTASSPSEAMRLTNR
jgi:hypothetical protein